MNREGRRHLEGVQETTAERAASTAVNIERAPGVEHEYTPYFPSLEELAKEVEAYMDLPANKRTGYMEPTMSALRDAFQDIIDNQEKRARLIEVIQAMSPGDTIDVEVAMAGDWDGTKQEAAPEKVLVTLARSEVKEESVLELNDGEYQVAERSMAAPYWTLAAVKFEQTTGKEPGEVRTRKQKSSYTWHEDQDKKRGQYHKGIQGPTFMSTGAEDLKDW